MKLAVSSFAWPRERALDAARFLSASPQVSGVELVLPMAFDDPAAATADEVLSVRRLWEDHGLRVVSVQSLAYGRNDLQLLGDARAREAFLDHLERMAQLAHDLGADRMVFGSPANRRRGNMPIAEANALATDFFQQLGDRVAATGVVVCIEANPPIYADCDFILHTEEALALVRAVGHRNIALQLDTGAIIHAHREGRSLSSDELQDASSAAAHLHFSLPGLGPVERGDTELASVAQEFSGAPLAYCSIEMRHPEGNADPFASISEAIDAISTWCPIEPRT